MMTKEMLEMMYHPQIYFLRLEVRREKMRTRTLWWRLSPAERIYCQLRSATGDDREAFKAAFPTERKIGWTAMKKRIYRLNCSRKVQRYMKTLDDEFAAKTMDGYINLKKRMIRMVLKSIKAKTATDPTAICRCRMEMFMLSKMLGWTARADADDDTRHSPQAKTDAELKVHPCRTRRYGCRG